MVSRAGFSSIVEVIPNPIQSSASLLDPAYQAPFLADFRDFRSAPFSFCLLMLQKWAVRQFWPQWRARGGGDSFGLRYRHENPLGLLAVSRARFLKVGDGDI
jgi:hypothetical protein